MWELNKLIFISTQNKAWLSTVRAPVLTAVVIIISHNASSWPWLFLWSACPLPMSSFWWSLCHLCGSSTQPRARTQEDLRVSDEGHKAGFSNCGYSSKSGDCVVQVIPSFLFSRGLMKRYIKAPTTVVDLPRCHSVAFTLSVLCHSIRSTYIELFVYSRLVVLSFFVLIIPFLLSVYCCLF